MTYVRVPVPRFDAGLISNLLGLVGLVLLIVAPGGLTGNWWWSVVAGGIVGVTLSYLIALRADERVRERLNEEEKLVKMNHHIRATK